MRYALARLVIAVGRMVSALGWKLIPPDRRLGHYIGSTFPRERKRWTDKATKAESDRLQSKMDEALERLKL